MAWNHQLVWMWVRLVRWEYFKSSEMFPFWWFITALGLFIGQVLKEQELQPPQDEVEGKVLPKPIWHLKYWGRPMREWNYALDILGIHSARAPSITPRRNEGYLKAHLGYHIEGSEVGPYTVVSHEPLGAGVFSVAPWPHGKGEKMIHQNLDVVSFPVLNFFGKKQLFNYQKSIDLEEMNESEYVWVCVICSILTWELVKVPIESKESLVPIEPRCCECSCP